MTRVVGFEGGLSEGALASWGAAALCDDEWVWNAYSKLRRPASDLKRLYSDEGLSEVEIDLQAEEDLERVTVVAVRQKHRGASIFAPSRSISTIAKKRAAGIAYYVFAGTPAFDRYANDVAATAARHVLEYDLPDEAARDIVYAALGFRPYDPTLHALRVARLEHYERGARLAEAVLRTDRDRRLFRSTLAALTVDDDKYVLKYDGGIAEGGGLDVETAFRQMEAIQYVDERLTEGAHKRTPLLSKGTAPGMRVTELVAASASLGFSVKIKGEGRLQRVARYFGLQTFQDAVRGDIPPELKRDEQFMKALRRVVAPSPETSITQKPLGQTEEEHVAPPEAFEKSPHQDVPMRLLGFIVGTINPTKSFAIQLFPSLKLAASFSANEDGEFPRGVTVASSRNDFLFVPAVMELQREIGDGVVQFRMLGLELLESARSWPIDAMPSSVVPGAFMTRQQLSVERTLTGDLVVGGRVLGTIPERPPVENARDWLERFAVWAREHELAVATEANGARWLPTPKRRLPNKLERICIELEAQPMKAEELLDRLYSGSAGLPIVTRGDLARLAEKHADLLSFDVENETVSLTLQGRGFVRAYTHAAKPLFD